MSFFFEIFPSEPDQADPFRDFQSQAVDPLLTADQSGAESLENMVLDPRSRRAVEFVYGDDFMRYEPEDVEDPVVLQMIDSARDHVQWLQLNYAMPASEAVARVRSDAGETLSLHEYATRQLSGQGDSVVDTDVDADAGTDEAVTAASVVPEEVVPAPQQPAKTKYETNGHATYRKGRKAGSRRSRKGQKWQSPQVSPSPQPEPVAPVEFTGVVIDTVEVSPEPPVTQTNGNPITMTEASRDPVTDINVIPQVASQSRTRSSLLAGLSAARYGFVDSLRTATGGNEVLEMALITANEPAMLEAPAEEQVPTTPLFHTEIDAVLDRYGFNVAAPMPTAEQYAEISPVIDRIEGVGEPNRYGVYDTYRDQETGEPVDQEIALDLLALKQISEAKNRTPEDVKNMPDKIRVFGGVAVSQVQFGAEWIFRQPARAAKAIGESMKSAEDGNRRRTRILLGAGFIAVSAIAALGVSHGADVPNIEVASGAGLDVAPGAEATTSAPTPLPVPTLEQAADGGTDVSPDVATAVIPETYLEVELGAYDAETGDGTVEVTAFEHVSNDITDLSTNQLDSFTNQLRIETLELNNLTEESARNLQAGEMIRLLQQTQVDAILESIRSTE